MLARPLLRPLAASLRFSPLARCAFAARAATFKSDLEHKSKSHGSYHWTFERSLSIALIPLFGSAVFLGPVPAVDFLLGFVLPLHCHLGFESIVTDYIPARVYKVLNIIAVWAVRILSGLVIYGCYVINTADVGLTAFAKRLWTGKL
eukprot:jgi/Hompol1/4488/HPOL_000550-RA